MQRITISGGALGFNALPIHLAISSGIFADLGLDVQTLRTGRTDLATAAVQDGSAHLALTPPEGAIANCIAGGDLRIVAGNVNQLPLSLVAHPGFETIEQLKGARLGTSSLTEGTAIYTMEMLGAHGLVYPADYSFDVVGVHTARWEALQHGRIDAAVQLLPYDMIAFAHGFSDLGSVGRYIPEIIFTAFVARESWVEQNSEIFIRLIQALRQATHQIYRDDNDSSILPLLERHAGYSPEYARETLRQIRSRGIVERYLDVPQAAFETSLRLMIKANLMAEQDIPAAQAALHLTYLKQANL